MQEFDEYTIPTIKKASFDFSRFEKPVKVKQTWEGVDVVDFFKEYFDISDKGAFGYSSWLKRVKDAKVKMYHAKELVKIMENTEQWLKKSKGETMHRGKWMFNRFRYDIKEKGIDKYISSKK